MRLCSLKRRLWIRGLLGAAVSAQQLRSLGTVTLWHFQMKEEDSGRITDNQTQTVPCLSPLLNGTSSDSLPRGVGALQ